MATIQDDRTVEEKKATIGFWVATDKFMSGWGGASGGKSYVACPVVSWEDSQEVKKRFMSRSEFKYVRHVSGNKYRPKMRENDHLHIYNTTTSFRYAL